MKYLVSLILWNFFLCPGLMGEQKFYPNFPAVSIITYKNYEVLNIFCYNIMSILLNLIILIMLLD